MTESSELWDIVGIDIQNDPEGRLAGIYELVVASGGLNLVHAQAGWSKRLLTFRDPENAVEEIISDVHLRPGSCIQYHLLHFTHLTHLTP